MENNMIEIPKEVLDFVKSVDVGSQVITFTEYNDALIKSGLCKLGIDGYLIRLNNNSCK